MKNIIEIKNLYKSYGDIKAVSDISFCVKEGELFAFLGTNGAGKSTTINVMCAQLKKDSGKVFIDGVDIDVEVDSIKSKLGVVFQRSVLDGALSVYDNLESRAALYGIVGEDFKKRLTEICEMLDIEPLLKRTVSKLSGGQRRRIDVARALVHKPTILILDEPTAALDPIAEDEIYKKYNEIAKDTTSIFISHRLASTRFCDRIFLLDNNKLAEVGTHDELIKLGGKYKELFDVQSQYYKEGENENEEKQEV